jgi:uncharacterized protein YutE (UPF0331/DUF86 family)
MNDIFINKIQSIQRCVERVREEYNKNPEGFDSDYTLQDAAVLNILRACEQAIDLANHIIKMGKMGIPNSSADSFELLQKKDVIDYALCVKLKTMSGFRNIVVHQYQRMDIEIMKKVIQYGLNDLIVFADKIVEYTRSHRCG